MREKILFNSHFVTKKNLNEDDLMVAIGVGFAAYKIEGRYYLNMRDLYVSIYGLDKVERRKMNELKEGLLKLESLEIIENLTEFDSSVYLFDRTSLFKKNNKDGFWVDLYMEDIHKIYSSSFKNRKRLMQFFIQFLTRRDSHYAKSKKYKYKFINDSMSYLSKKFKITEKTICTYLNELEELEVIYVVKRKTRPDRKQYYKYGNVYCLVRDKDLLLEFLQKLDGRYGNMPIENVEKIIKSDTRSRKKEQRLWGKYTWVTKGKKYSYEEMRDIYRVVLLYNDEQETRAKHAKEQGKNFEMKLKDLSYFDEYDFATGMPAEDSPEYISFLLGYTN